MPGWRASRIARSGVIAVGLALASGAPAQEAPQEAVETASTRYQASWLHRLFLGDDYRALWGAPVQLEVLDLGRYAGGLAPVRRVGAGQSTGLALKGADGHAYTFRGLEKDATRSLPPDLQATIAGRIAQDQVAAMHPGATVVAGPLLEAAGVLHVEARLVVMPDDPRLGPFRADFANVLGTIQEFPRPGFAGSTELVDGEELLARLRRSPDDPADARAYLRARLVDLFLGDWDRHLGQWRWARIPGRPGWQPIPEDRDFAFCRFEGLVLAVARNWIPRWVSFGDRYPDLVGLTWQAWPLDRILLSGLERPAWAELAAEVTRSLDDRAIAEAVARLPRAYQREDGARLEAALRARRDRLAEVAERFYLQLAEEVRVDGSDGPDVAVATGLPGGALLLTVARAEAEGAPYFQRVFLPSETREVRLELGGGADRFERRGRSDVLLRVVGGEGDDVLDDSAGGGTRLADWQGENRIAPGPGTRLDTRPYEPPPLASRTPYLPARDWGRQVTWLPWFGASPELGAFVGAGVRLERFGFRTYPRAGAQVLRVGWAAGAQAFRADYAGELREENARHHFRLEADASQLEVLRWFGEGNETSSAGSDAFHEVRRTRVAVAPSVRFAVAQGLEAWTGASFSRAWTRLPGDRLVGQERPYGSAPFGQAGLEAGLHLDLRDVEAHPTRGLLVDLRATFHPAWWDVSAPFGRLRAEVAWIGSAPWPLRPALALRAAAERVLGEHPFHESAFVGGPTTLRGYAAERFAGDAGAFANAELRLRLARYFLVLPGECGVFALADAGRVWLRGEASDRWHASAGGGFWFAYVHPRNTVSIAVARGAERTGLYLRTGFLF